MVPTTGDQAQYLRPHTTNGKIQTECIVRFDDEIDEAQPAKNVEGSTLIEGRQPRTEEYKGLLGIYVDEMIETGDEEFR